MSQLLACAWETATIQGNDVTDEDTNDVMTGTQ
jgi:hypothetical protein